MIDLVVGCPVRDRAWIMPDWFKGVERACGRLEINPRYVFVGPRGDPTLREVRRQCTIYGRNATYVHTGEESRAYERSWLPDRLQQLVDLRNELLRQVRALEPEFFLSVDSDVILHGRAIQSLLSAQLEGYDAVGGKCYLSTGPRDFACPSYFNMSRSMGPSRVDDWSLKKVDVIMAIKLMTPAAYSIDYEFSHNGEDTGWSKACTRAGLRLAWDGRVCSLHVMAPKYLGKDDPRVLNQPEGWP